MSKDGRRRSVTFEPQGATLAVPEGTPLHEAAQAAGVELPLPCGAQGRCGRCLVKVERGSVERRPNAHLSPQQVSEGWALACHAGVSGDVVVTVPPRLVREQVVGYTADRKAALPFAFEWPHDPPVERLSLELPSPSLEDSLSDLERLRRELAKQRGVAGCQVELGLARELPHRLREGGWRVSAYVERGRDGEAGRLVELLPHREGARTLGAAIDLGTTTVVVHLVDLESGKVLGGLSAYNRQISCGEDVISRIVYSKKGKGLAHLQRLVVETANELLDGLVGRHRVEQREIVAAVAAGNTTMTHLFLGLDPRHIREEPYTPAATHFPLARAGELGLAINPRASVHCLPAVAAYVGGDIVAGVLASGVYHTDKLTLFLDVGTNGELVLGNHDWLLTCACSAGPAFEGAGVRCGMRATAGAIEEVRISSQTLEPTIKVIEDVPPLGICGSGMISALAELFLTGVVDKAGKMPLEQVRLRRMKDPRRLRQGDHGNEYVIVWAEESGTGQDIVLTEVDIDNLIRTKGAIYSGINIMLRKVGISVGDLEQVLIGGAFGQHINVEEAIQIGLLPDLPWERFKFLGNTSIRGAQQALLALQARSMAEEIAGRMTYLELIADPGFMSEYTSSLFLPHTDLGAFPSVQSLLEQTASLGNGALAGGRG